MTQMIKSFARSASTIGINVLDSMGLIEKETGQDIRILEGDLTFNQTELINNQQITTNKVINDNLEIMNKNNENEGIEELFRKEIESLVIANNWKDILDRNIDKILRLTHDDFVDMNHKNFEMKKALEMRKYLMDKCLIKINERDKLIAKQRRTHEKVTCSDIYYLIKLCACNESEIFIKDIEELVFKQLFELSKGARELSQPKKRKSDQINGDDEEDVDENEVIYMEQYIQKNEFEINKLKDLNIKVEKEICELRQMYNGVKNENKNLKEEIAQIKMLYEQMLEEFSKSSRASEQKKTKTLETKKDNYIITSTDDNEVINVEMESITENNELDWFDKDPNSFAGAVKMSNNNTKPERTLISNQINQSGQNNALNEKNNNNFNNNNTTVIEHFRPQQQKQSIANNKIERSDYSRDKNANSYRNYQSRNKRTYQSRNYSYKNQYYYRNDHGYHNSRQSFSNNNRSYVYKKDDQIIIGSQSGKLVNIVANNNNRKSKDCRVYLGNVNFGTKFDLIEKMLNEMDIEYKNLTELKNKHRFFQSYYFEIPQEKVSKVFNSRNWEQGLIVREFR